MTTNELWTLGVAIYAAIVATAVGAWDVWKWTRSGPRLELRVGTDVKPTNRSFFEDPNGKVVTFTVYNGGDQATTLGAITYRVYPNRIAAFLRLRSIGRFMPDLSVVSCDLPKMLNPGEQWIGSCDQDAKFEALMRDYVVMGSVESAAAIKIKRRRLKIAPPAS